MTIISLIKKNKLLAAVALIYLLLFVTMPDKAVASAKNSIYYIIEMLQIMPVIFLLTSIIETWVPKEVIANRFSEKAGIKGNIISFALGSLSAGPVYAAFPVCKMLLKKGASVANIVIILSTWAVIKVPMLANEAKFLGPKFMGARWILTTISIFIMSYLVTIIVKKEDLATEISDHGGHYGKVYIEEKYCIGCGICSRISPEIFKIENKKAKLKQDHICIEEMKNIKAAVERCPSKAISF